MFCDCIFPTSLCLGQRDSMMGVVRLPGTLQDSEIPRAWHRQLRKGGRIIAKGLTNVVGYHEATVFRYIATESIELVMQVES